jgi:glycosyltransferase involved in cell wall biosynthesis
MVIGNSSETSIKAIPTQPRPALNFSVTFIMEQVLGHVSYYKNLKQAVTIAPEVRASWVEVTYKSPKNPLNKLSFIQGPLVGYTSGLWQTGRGLWRGRRDKIIFFHTQKPAVLFTPLLRLKKFAVSLDITPAQYDRYGAIYEDPGNTTGQIARLKHALNKYLFASSNLIISWSEWVKESLCREYGVNPDKGVVIPPGIDLARWQAGTLPRPAKAPGELPRILFCGGDWERKGGPQLLEWFTQRGHQLCELHLVTRAPISNPDNLPNLFVYNNFNANDPALIELYRQSDIFALPTLAEAFGIALTEAMAMGLPVVTTRVGACAEIVEDGGTGFLVEAGNVAELGQKLEELLSNTPLRQRMSVQAREKAITRYDAVKNGQELLGVLAGLIEKAT